MYSLLYYIVKIKSILFSHEIAKHGLMATQIILYSDFETVSEICMQHIIQIKSALQIAGVSSIDSSYIVRGNDEVEGIQIDLIIDRADDVINVCEMKFCKSYFEVTQSYAEKLACRTALLESRNPGKTFLMTLISATTLKQNEYSEIFSSNISIDELFR